MIYSRGDSCPACLLIQADPRSHRLDRRYREKSWVPWLWFEDTEDGRPYRRFCRVCGSEWRWHGVWVLVRQSAFVVRGEQGEVRVNVRRRDHALPQV